MFGAINLLKPAGVTSRDVVNRVQRILKPVKCGHAGTLDPMATGVLLVAIGPATRLVSCLQDRSKTYEAEFTLGQTSDTDDSTGQVTRNPDANPVLPEVLLDTLQQLCGVIDQVPPAFSAVHVNGQRAYDLARRGELVELQARPVEIHRIDVTAYEWPLLSLRIECGSGTYIRSMARDLGKKLGCGALMSRLHRSAIGEFEADTALAVDSLSRDVIEKNLIDPGRIVSDYPHYHCDAVEVGHLRCGRSFPASADHGVDVSSLTAPASVALVDGTSNELMAIAELTPAGTLQPRLVFCHSH